MTELVTILLSLSLLRALEGFLICPIKEQTVSFPQYGTAILPCLFRPSHDVLRQRMRVSWQKEHKMEDLVVHFQNGYDTGDKQNEIFKGRTMVSKNWSVKGNATLTIGHLTRFDAGKYTCWITMYPIRPGLQRRCCVVMLNISEERLIKKNTLQGDDNSPPPLDQALAISMFILVLLLFCIVPLLLFNTNLIPYQEGPQTCDRCMLLPLPKDWSIMAPPAVYTCGELAGTERNNPSDSLIPHPIE